MKRGRETRQKVVFVMIDGLADVSIPRLGHKSPLQAAKTPMMDTIARSHPRSRIISLLIRCARGWSEWSDGPCRTRPCLWL